MDQTHYDVLELSESGTLQDVERAYRIARATYQPGSSATYSIYTDEDNTEILRRIEEAYMVLSDARLRREYDAKLRRDGQRSGQRTESAIQTFAGASDFAGIPVEQVDFAGAEQEVRPLQQALPPSEPEPLPPRMPALDLVLDDTQAPEDGVFDGPVLRRLRMSHGVEIEEISAITKVNELYLQFIEENRYHDLPAPVYIRGFLREYAKCLNLDPKVVQETYMERYRKRLGEG